MKIQEGYTTFNTAPRPYFNPDGHSGKWFGAFFTDKGAKTYDFLQRNQGSPIPSPLSGDTIKSLETIRNGRPASLAKHTTPFLPQLEYNRRRRYREFEKMDDYPEISTAFDIYADDCTQEDTKGRRWTTNTTDPIIQRIIEDLFSKIKLEDVIWDISRNTVKFGDCFIEMIIDLNNAKKGIQRIKVLNPNYILRVEDEFGYLIGFMQEIPKTSDFSSDLDTFSSERLPETIALDRHQIVHFRLHTSDPAIYPYGKSIAAPAIEIYQSLKLMEDGMLIYRLSRAPERRIFYVDVGNLPTTKAETYIEKLKDKFKKERFFNSNLGNVDGRYNPLSFDEDFYVPIRGNRGTKIETLPGAQNLGEVDDVKYFRDKLLAALKIPKDYVVEKDKSPERKANLAQLDVKFARTVTRVQQSIEAGLTVLAKRHLQLKGFPQHIIQGLKVKLPSPSDMFEKRQLDIEEQRLRVASQAKSSELFSDDYIYRRIFDLSDHEIADIKNKIKDELDEKEAMGISPMGDPMFEDPMVGVPEEGEDGIQDPNMDQEAGGQEPNENETPTKVADATIKTNQAILERALKRIKKSQ